MAFEIKTPQFGEVPLLPSVSLRKLNDVIVNKTIIKCNHPMTNKLKN